MAAAHQEAFSPHDEGDGVCEGELADAAPPGDGVCALHLNMGAGPRGRGRTVSRRGGGG